MSAMTRRGSLAALGLGAVGCATSGAVTPAPHPAWTPAQRAWRQLGYGMFLHLGPDTVEGVSTGDGKFPASEVVFPQLDCRQWAAVAVEAGMKYAVLTAKHHDGYCLWPTKQTDYCVRSSPGGRDIVGEFVRAFRDAGLAVGLYYSLWDRHAPMYDDDDAYAGYMQAQLAELLTSYGPLVEVWFDGAWDKDFPTRDWVYDPAWERDPKSGLGHGERWRWRELYAHIHRLQPDTLVLNNASSDRAGLVRYLPVDVRTAERFDFVWGGRQHPVTVQPELRDASGAPVHLPLEYCDTITPGWFWRHKAGYSHPPAEAIAAWIRRARRDGANLLLNVGPDARGLIPDYHRPFLRDAIRIA
jgi:alpha-L-fucosidase